jgi:adenine C2-methylase RlmN of 23S rRNA A2503 and tRNA A37
MLKVIKQKDFTNGSVYLLETEDGYRIETTDTFLPYYTKDAIGRNQNALKNEFIGDRNERWMIGVSVSSGCPVGCKFCATGKMNKFRNLTAQEIVEQILFIIKQNPDYSPRNAKEFKINYTRMGDFALNIDNVREAIDFIDLMGYKHGFNVHHYLSTIGIKGTDFSWIRDNITLQVSLHSLDEKNRDWLIPFKNKMSIKELGEIRTESDLKTTVNLTLVKEEDFDIERLKEYFDPEKFFIKLSPINPNEVSDGNELGNGIIEGNNLV